MEIAASSQPLPLVRQPEQTMSAILVIGASALLATFITGLLIGASGSVRPFPVEKTVSLPPAAVPPTDATLLREARAYVGFWKHRESRLDQAARRLGWRKADLAKAMRLIDAAKPRFEAVAAALGIMDDATLKREMNLLYEQVALTYCEEFRLACVRGVPPDQARPKKAHARKPVGRS